MRADLPVAQADPVPRQRIVGWREIARRTAEGSDPAALKALSAAYDYQGIDTCAACGLCATACPVGIETGLLVKSLRGQRRGAVARGVGGFVAGHTAGVLAAARTGLRLADLARRVAGPAVVETAARVLTGGHIPALPDSLPRAIDFTPPEAAEGPADAPELAAPTVVAPTVVYVPSCVSRSMGPAAGDPQDTPLPQTVDALMRKAGFRVVYPDGLAAQCCGMPLESKGLPEQADAMADAMIAALRAASDGGRHPVVMDTSPCALRLKKRLAGGMADGGLRLLDVAEFLHDHALPRLDIVKSREPVVLHLTCSTRRMGLDGTLKAVAQACAETVVVPEDVGCCGFAGDKGFTTPELNAHALRHLAKDIPEGCSAGYSTSRTCEIGLSHHAGLPYRSIVYLVDACSRPKAADPVRPRRPEPAF
ncbi:(Fe-S)-binding protein [Azospirillum thermophilum]|uniref:(Fe-S)-binding protein n=1 Tax=Azospirillum thermophilum TaxID=2202148 RepID=UPI001FE2D7BD|nr:(Fe-S)-binding protein [Azospirillum thermophilum]